jgi:hypothetical protein
MFTRLASASTERSLLKLSAIQRSSSIKTSDLAAACEASNALYCDCPPARLRYTTRMRAMFIAQRRPASSSISASARSIPLVTPADVHKIQ